MRTVLKYGLALLCLLPILGYAADQFPAQQSFAGQALNLNGKGIRSKAFLTFTTLVCICKQAIVMPPPFSLLINPVQYGSKSPHP